MWDQRSVSHRERLIHELRADPELALHYIIAAAEDNDPGVLASALKTLAAAKMGGVKQGRG
jgi:DNA-binding phage protein